jgi:hypothetical protein
MKLLDELLDLGDAALEDQVAVVGLALGDLAGAEGSLRVITARQPPQTQWRKEEIQKIKKILGVLPGAFGLMFLR